MGCHQLKQAWLRLSIDLLGAEVALLAQAWLWKAGPSSLPPAPGSIRLPPNGSLISILPARWLKLQWDAGDLALSLLVMPRAAPSSCRKDTESKARGVWKVAGFFFFF